MVGTILGFFGSAAAGGITGLIGALGSKIADYFTYKQKCAFDLAMRDKDMAIAKIEADKDVTIARDTNATNLGLGEIELSEKSHDDDKATYATHDLVEHAPTWAAGLATAFFAFVDFIRGMTRPGLTLYLVVLTTIIYENMDTVIKAAGVTAFSPGDALKIVVMIVDAVLYLTSTAVTWWFGSRPKSTK